MNAMMLGAAAVALLLIKARGESSGTPALKVVPGGKSSQPSAAKPKPKPKPKPSTPHALVLSPVALPADTRDSAARAADQPVPSDMVPAGSGPLVDMDGHVVDSPTDPGIVDPWQSDAGKDTKPPLAKPKKPKPPKKRGGSPPSAAKLAKPAKRTGKQAASDLKDYLDQGGNAGSRNNRSTFVRSAQTDMGGLTADGIYGPKTRARARALGIDIQH